MEGSLTSYCFSQQTIAIKYNSRKISYETLNLRSNSLADSLIRTYACARNSAIGICMEKIPEAVISILGILKAGCGYVPLDPHYPRDRLQLMIEDSGLKVFWIDHSSPGNYPLH
jgi:non-ribosomal peptide synthetase component F